MVQLPVALRARMDISGHTQKDVEATTGVSQSQISRALNGKRKRPTEAMQKLCRYANLEIKNESASALAELYALLQQVIAGGPAAAACVKGVLESLVPLLENPARYKRKK